MPADGAANGLSLPKTNDRAPHAQSSVGLAPSGCAADSLGDLANNARGRGDGKPQRWAATITTPEHVLILGYFHGRPSAVTVASLYSDILTGKAKAVGSYSASGKDIVINVPADN